MRMLGGLLGLTLVGLLVSLGTSCGAQQEQTHGTSVGSFSIDGALVENTCAPGLDPIADLTFYAELRRDDGVGYWRQEGGTIISGTMASDGRFRFSTRAEIPAYGPDPDLGTAGCSLYQTETISGTLVSRAEDDAGTSDGGQPIDAGTFDAGADAGPRATFVGESVIVISSTPGSNCQLLLAMNGGDFPTFPCQASYELHGTSR